MLGVLICGLVLKQKKGGCGQCAIDLNKKDIEIKELIGSSDADLITIYDFQISDAMRAILNRRQKKEHHEFKEHSGFSFRSNWR